MLNAYYLDFIQYVTHMVDCYKINITADKMVISQFLFVRYVSQIHFQADVSVACAEKNNRLSQTASLFSLCSNSEIYKQNECLHPAEIFVLSFVSLDSAIRFHRIVLF
jgi:hypothetical protein